MWRSDGTFAGRDRSRRWRAHRHGGTRAPIPSAAARHTAEGNHPGMADIGLVVMLLSDKDLTVHGSVEAIKVQATR